MWTAPPPGAIEQARQPGPMPYAPHRPHPAAPASAPQTIVLMQQPQKTVGVAYLFAILLGEFGAHRFYLGRPVSAIVMMLLWLTGIATTWLVVGFFLLLPAFIWWVVDLCILPGMVREANRRAGSQQGMSVLPRV